MILTIILTGCTNSTSNNVEDSDIGYIQEDINSTDITSELLGNWEATEGLPNGLIRYSLTFNDNGQVEQVSQIENEDETSETSNFIMDGDTVKILDPNNTVLMALDFNYPNLTTQDLGDSETAFTKKS